VVAGVAEEEACAKEADAHTAPSQNDLVGERDRRVPVSSLPMWPFRDSKDAIPTFTVENTIAAGSRVRGDVSGPGGFRVDGAIEGALAADGPVVIGDGGSVDGDIRGRDVTVLGRVRGDVVASGHLEIGPKGKVLGNVTAQSFRMHAGGVFRGTSCMGEAEEAPPLAVLGLVRDAPRGRTLPPPNGAVPPPPMLGDLGSSSSALVPEDVASQQRLISSSNDDVDASTRATGT
jgi:cytoskeletal protein CcmA (bactofilin family)